MEQEKRMLFARCNNLKRKKRSYQYKARPGQESSDEEECEETPESQIGSTRVYQLHEESEGWSRKPQTNKTAPVAATKSEKAMSNKYLITT